MTIAKLTPPNPDRAYSRTRLFRQLDSLRDYPVVWISGPPGAGKTTLVASYLAANDITPLWYQIDPSDGDIASFFYHLGEGLKQLNGSRKRILPLLTPEYQLGLPAFSRRFFRKLFANLKASSVIVLDNIETLNDEPIFNAILRHSLEETPSNRQVLITGRCLPPAQFRRMILNGRLGQLGWNHLQLTTEESLGIIESRFGRSTLSDAAIQQIQDITQGWVAGLILLLSRQHPGDPLTNETAVKSAENFSRQHFDDYFASEVFDQLPAKIRTLLLRTAWLPSVNAEMAAALCGSVQTIDMLQTLADNQLFVTRRDGADPAYIYHPLLKAFLQAEAARTLSPQALTRLIDNTAEILARSDRTDEAARLYARIGHWPGLVQLILDHAQTLWGQGRFRLLRKWLEMVPADQRACNPWLSYWYGNTKLLSEPESAARHFKTAFRRFEAAGDSPGACLSLTGILDSIMYRNDSLAEVPHWLDVLQTWQQQGPCPVPGAAVRLDFTAFNLRFLACPGQYTPAQWQALAQRLEAAVFLLPDDTLRCLCASHLAMYYTWHPQPARLQLLADSVYKYAISDRVTPLARLIAYLVEITRRWVLAETEGTDAVIREALQVMADHGVYISRLWLLSAAIFYYLTRRDLDTAATLLEQFHEHVRPRHRNEEAHYHFLAGWLACLQGKLEQAHIHATTACSIIQKLHSPHFELLSHILLCLTLIRKERFDEAQRRIGEAKALAAAIHARNMEVHHLGLLEAWIVWRQGRVGQALDHLRTALACGRELSLRVSPVQDPHLLAGLCALALEHGIEPDYVKHLIRWNDLPPPRDACLLSSWPMAVRIQTLGRFGLSVHGKHLSWQPASNKPLQLLQVLISFGGREVTDGRIEDILWPDAEADAAHRALITNVQRLRRLLGVHQAILHRDGRLGLNPHYCWVDAWALERNPQNDDPESLVPLLELYRGRFLRDVGAPPWVLPLRERLHNLILRHYGRLLLHLTETGRWQDLITLCHRGLQIDDLHEPFYQGLMLAHRQMGQYGEAVRVYQRCRDQLRNRLNASPGPQTRALFESLPLESG